MTQMTVYLFIDEFVYFSFRVLGFDSLLGPKSGPVAGQIGVNIAIDLQFDAPIVCIKKPNGPDSSRIKLGMSRISLTLHFANSLKQMNGSDHQD